MGAVTQWEIEKLVHAEELYTLLTALVGDVEVVRRTEASLSWHTTAGVQGHWRVANGTFWLGRIIWQSDGRQSAQLVLALDSLGDEEEHVGLAHPTVYQQRNGDGLLSSHAPETPQIYAAAQALLTQLAQELCMMLAPAREAPEETGDDA